MKTYPGDRSGTTYPHCCKVVLPGQLLEIGKEIAAHIIVVEIALVVILAGRIEKVVRQRVDQEYSDPNAVFVLPSSSHLAKAPEIIILFSHKLRHRFNLFPRLGNLPRTTIVRVRIFETAIVLLKYRLGLHGEIRIDGLDNKSIHPDSRLRVARTDGGGGIRQ